MSIFITYVQATGFFADCFKIETSVSETGQFYFGMGAPMLKMSQRKPRGVRFSDYSSLSLARCMPFFLLMPVTLSLPAIFSISPVTWRTADSTLKSNEDAL